MEAFSKNILLGNLIRIRWIAIFGQFTAIYLVYLYFKIDIPLLACIFIVLISAAINIYSYFINKNNIYLSDKKTFYFLLFDTIQLGILLCLTGGIYNPFSLLLIAPLIISASYLPMVYSICLLILSITTVIFISNIYLSINWNEPFNIPIFFKYGLTLSLIISLIFIFIYVYLFANFSRRISKALLQTRSALSNQKKISEIGSLSAAAVHELSTPLNTIFLILNDLLEDESVKKNTSVRKEVQLLKSEADRCKNILLTLSKNPENLKDNFFDKITLTNLIKINFDKFSNQNIELEINYESKKDEPVILAKDELVYGIGNIIQNAIQHAKLLIKIDISWNKNEFIIIINDDGNGFENEVIDQLGKPYISRNNQGMGLGIFIAKNLIENIGGSINFNNTKFGGASVEIKINRDN
jgi:two-component system sensor histidine kinase RegB